MGNLGKYQLITTLAKRVGGPGRLVAITAATGYVVGRLGEAGVKRIPESVRRWGEPSPISDRIFEVTSDGRDGELQLRAGRQFRVLERDGNAILIEVIGDPSNPYFVSYQFLESVSNYSMEPDA